MSRAISAKRQKVEAEDRPRSKKAPRTPSPVQRRKLGSGVDVRKVPSHKVRSDPGSKKVKALGGVALSPKDQVIVTGVSRAGRERKLSTGGGRRSLSPANTASLVKKVPEQGEQKGEPMPEAILLENDKGEKYFLLVQRVKKPKPPKGMVMLRLVTSLSASNGSALLALPPLRLSC